MQEDYDDEEDMEEEGTPAGDSENEQDGEARVQELISQLNENPYDFALYQQLIEVYRSLGNLEELRQVRERVHTLYCLPVDMWLAWLEDEERLAFLSGADDD